ncbi:MAG TPA: tetratricopeptide repeat protein [Gammaproteobacteria bacterium]|nr:tetratricopeptide repeat protein [Gammaproteobacteria bacterium]
MKPARNQPCPCGSGRKFKHCCGAAKPTPNPAPPQSSAALQRALALHRSGQLAQAETLYRQVLESDPRHPGALHLLGVITGQRGDPAGAVTLIRRALAIQPRLPEAHNNLGLFLQAQGDWDAAATAHRAALKLRPDYAEAHNNLGNALRAQGQLEQAAACYRQALVLQPRYAEAHLNLGLAHHARAAPEAAAACYRSALSIRPEFADAHHNLGLALQDLGQIDEAERCYHAALALQPQRAEAHNNLANLLRSRGQLPDAVDAYRRALAARPAYAEARCNLGVTLSDLGHWAESAAQYREALRTEPACAPAHCGLGRLFHAQGAFQEARSSYREAIRVRPDYVEPYCGLVRCGPTRAEDGPLLTRMEALAGDPGRSRNEAIDLHAALGKAYDDLAAYDRAMAHIQRKNRLEASDGAFDRERHRARIRALTTTAAGAGPGMDSELPVLIVGMPRSGTTLVEQILARHPEVGVGGELEFWARWESRHMPEPQTPPDPAATRAAAGDYLTHLQGLAPGAARVTDKLTTNFLRLGLICHLLPGARIIHCRRDPLDTCLSVYFTRFASAHPYAHDLDDLAFYYASYRRLMVHWQTQLPPERFLEVDYEDLVTEPEGMARRLVAFCGLAWNPRCVGPSVGARAIRTASKWQARQPVYTTSVGRWRHYARWLEPLQGLRAGDIGP